MKSGDLMVRVSVVFVFALSVFGKTQAQSIAYIYGDVAANGNIPSGGAPFHQMLLTDTQERGCSRFKTMVEGEGYSISQYYDAATTLNASFLDQFDVVVFGLHQKIWSPSEKAALDTWIRAGGGIMMYSDSAAGGSFSQVPDGIKNTIGQTAVNNILSAYGMEVTVDLGGGTRSYTSINDDSNPITSGSLAFEGEGVSPVAVDLTSGAQVLYPLDSAFLVAGGNLTLDTRNITITNPAWAAVALQEVDDGKVIAIFDRQPMWNDGEGSSIQQRDNEEVLRRIINYLAADPIPIEQPKLSATIANNPGDGMNYLEVSYRQASGGNGTVGYDYLAGGNIYRLQIHPDLDPATPWESSALAVEEVGSPVDHGDGTETVTVRILQEIVSTPVKFVRLLVGNSSQLLQVEAGSGKIIGEGGTAVLDGSTSGAVVSNTWSKFSGPGSVTIANSTATETTATFSTAGIYQMMLTAESASEQISDLVEIEVIASADVIRAINCGGSVYAGNNGFTYEADTLFTGGHTDNFPGNPVEGSVDAPLYNVARSGHSAYDIPVANGNYRVLLQFAETFFTANNKRVFDTSIEGNLVLDDLDLHASAPGKWVAYNRYFVTTVSDGVLNLDFTASTNNALLNAIVVIAE